MDELELVTPLSFLNETHLEVSVMLRSLLSLIVFLLLISPAWSAELTQPNILFIMVDDLGKE